MEQDLYEKWVECGNPVIMRYPVDRIRKQDGVLQAIAGCYANVKQSHDALLDTMAVSEIYFNSIKKLKKTQEKLGLDVTEFDFKIEANEGMGLNEILFIDNENKKAYWIIDLNMQQGGE